MESFEKIWDQADLGQFKSNQRLKFICEKIVKTHLSGPHVTSISISKDGYIQAEDASLTFDIIYFFSGQKKAMQVNFYNEDTDQIENIPDSIAFN
jgi:hypothetical protein